MRNINKVILIGNVSHAPQTKETGNGQPVTTFGVATHRYFTTKSGENKAVTEFHNIVAWGSIAKRCAETLRKGKLVFIEGYLKTRAFDLGEGKKSYRTEVVAYNMIILSKRELGEMASIIDIPDSPEKNSIAPEDDLDESNTF